MPDIRERNDRPKDKQPKHRTASAVQRQMVQKFVKELNDSAKQSDRSDSAERTATEQVETLPVKLSNSRVVRSSTQPAKNPRILPQMHSQSNPSSRTMHRNQSSRRAH